MEKYIEKNVIFTLQYMHTRLGSSCKSNSYRVTNLVLIRRATVFESDSMYLYPQFLQCTGMCQPIMPIEKHPGLQIYSCQSVEYPLGWDTSVSLLEIVVEKRVWSYRVVISSFV